MYVVRRDTIEVARVGRSRYFLGRQDENSLGIPFRAAAPIAYLIASALALGVTGQPVNAGCGTGKVEAWTINAVTGKKTSLGQGDHTQCGNIHGSFESVALPELRFGWARCITNCVEGATPNETTVQLNGEHKRGNVAKFSGWMVCVSQQEKPILYCWK